MSKNTSQEYSQLPESESDLPKGLGKPALRALNGAGYLRLEQFSLLTVAEVLQLHGVGPKAIKLIRQALAEKGLSFADAHISSNVKRRM